jgi:hypothetical protein
MFADLTTVKNISVGYDDFNLVFKRLDHHQQSFVRSCYLIRLEVGIAKHNNPTFFNIYSPPDMTIGLFNLFDYFCWTVGVPTPLWVCGWEFYVVFKLQRSSSGMG